jgi:hypothetical protein
MIPMNLLFAAPEGAALLSIAPVQAHDSWISPGGHRNAAGDWCGGSDCFMIPKERVVMTGTG